MYAVAEPWLAEVPPLPRDDCWLRRELDRIWDTHFRDIPRANHVEITFARYWRARLGLITASLDGHHTYIQINSYLRHHEVPVFVNVATLAHELVHYAHGFGSPLPRRYAHPHRGGIVAKELCARGLGKEHIAHQQWIRHHWHELFENKVRLFSDWQTGNTRQNMSSAGR